MIAAPMLLLSEQGGSCNVAINFGKDHRTISVFDPTSGPNPSFSQYNQSSVNVAINDSVMIVDCTSSELTNLLFAQRWCGAEVLEGSSALRSLENDEVVRNFQNFNEKYTSGSRIGND